MEQSSSPMALQGRQVRDHPSQTRLAAVVTRHELILFDAECALCSGFIGFVLRRDRRGRFRYVPVQSALGRAILGHFGQPLSDWESNVLVQDGKACFKSVAFFRIMGALPAPWSWLGRADLLPRSLADWLYDGEVGREGGFTIEALERHFGAAEPDG